MSLIYEEEVVVVVVVAEKKKEEEEAAVSSVRRGKANGYGNRPLCAVPRVIV